VNPLDGEDDLGKDGEGGTEDEVGIGKSWGLNWFGDFRGAISYESSREFKERLSLSVVCTGADQCVPVGAFCWRVTGRKRSCQA